MFFIGWGKDDILMEQQQDRERKGKLKLSVSPENCSSVSTELMKLYLISTKQEFLIKVPEFRRKKNEGKATWSVARSVRSNILQPHGLWPTRLLCPWDFPGKNTRVGCHFLLQGMKPCWSLNPLVKEKSSLKRQTISKNCRLEYTILTGKGQAKQMWILRYTERKRHFSKYCISDDF